MATIICTVGTSIGNGCEALRPLQRIPLAWDATEKLVDDFRQQVVGRLRGFDLRTEDGRVKASAELNSLHRLRICDGDDVILLASDTADCRISAEALGRAIESTFGATATVRRVEGLVVHDRTRFREMGLMNLGKAILTYASDPNRRYVTGGVVLNPTGGYKGVVPFVTVLGMLLGLKTVYVFEFSNDLIQLPPLPLSFDMGIFERALPALEHLRKEGAVPENEFFAKVRGLQDDERPRFASFLEYDPNDPGRMVTISPLLDMFWEMDHQGGDEVLISTEIANSLNTESPENVAITQWFLAHLAHPLWRGSHFHSFHGTGLQVFKPGNVAQRAACILDNQKVYVCEIFLAHSVDYEKRLRNRKRSDYDLAKFVSWQHPDDGRGPVEAADEALRLVSERKNEQLISEKQALQEKLATATQHFAQLDMDNRGMISKLKSAQDEAQKLQQKVERLTKELRLSDALNKTGQT